VAFYVLSEDKTRHAQMTGQQAKVAGTVNGQPKTVALIRGVQFKGEIRRLDGEESDVQRKHYTRRFPVALAFKAPVWEIRLDELKFTDNTLGFGKNPLATSGVAYESGANYRRNRAGRRVFATTADSGAQGELHRRADASPAC
jgi:uncharacterized protein YhbP (UPF0306 family)